MHAPCAAPPFFPATPCDTLWWHPTLNSCSEHLAVGGSGSSRRAHSRRQSHSLSWLLMAAPSAMLASQRAPSLGLHLRGDSPRCARAVPPRHAAFSAQHRLPAHRRQHRAPSPRRAPLAAPVLALMGEDAADMLSRAPDSLLRFSPQTCATEVGACLCLPRGN